MYWNTRLGARQVIRYPDELHNNLEGREAGGQDSDGKSFDYMSRILKWNFADSTKLANFGFLSAQRFSSAAAASQRMGGKFIIFSGLDINLIALDTIDVQSFADDSTAINSADLAEPLDRPAAFGSDENCFRGGGLDASRTLRIGTVGKVSAENTGDEELFETLGFPLQFPGGISNSTDGFFVGGNVGFVDVASVQKLAFANDVLISNWQALSKNVSQSAIGGNEWRIISCGGRVSGTVYSDEILFLDIHEDATGATLGAMASPRQNLASTCSQHTMFTHRGASVAGSRGETITTYQLEIDVFIAHVFFATVAGIAQASFQCGYGGSP